MEKQNNVYETPEVEEIKVEITPIMESTVDGGGNENEHDAPAD